MLLSLMHWAPSVNIEVIHFLRKTTSSNANQGIIDVTGKQT